MSGASDFLRPSGFRLILAATLVIPTLFLVLIVSGFTMWDPLVPVGIAIVIGYAAACVIDRLVRNRALKIAIASVAALVSIILGSLLVRSMTIICDPVHDPGMVCDPVHIPDTTPTVIATVVPSETTPMIFDPVHEPGGCSGDVCSVAPGVVTGIVAEKLDECRKKLSR
ncbi:MAG: hypothetical protein WC379_13950 [Methanoregula sp.]|jgi:hypothetical protein